jgi:hypothetical protein
MSTIRSQHSLLTSLNRFEIAHPSLVSDTRCLELGMESLLVLSHLLQFATLSPGNVSTSFQEGLGLLEEGRRDRRQGE